METEAYVIAVKRECRDLVPADWVEQLNSTSGLQVVSGNTRRVQVRASAEAIRAVRSHWGGLLHIEKALWRAPQLA